MALRRSNAPPPADEHVERSPEEARAGTGVRVNLIILIISTVAAAIALLVFLTPMLTTST